MLLFHPCPNLVNFVTKNCEVSFILKRSNWKQQISSLAKFSELLNDHKSSTFCSIIDVRITISLGWLMFGSKACWSCPSTPTYLNPLINKISQYSRRYSYGGCSLYLKPRTKIMNVLRSHHEVHYIKDIIQIRSAYLCWGPKNILIIY
jgi:hypothetical protein